MRRLESDRQVARSSAVAPQLGPETVYPPGTKLFRPDTPTRCVYLLNSGVVMIMALHDGREELMGLRTAGWLLGVPPAVRGRSHVATGITLTACEVCTLSLDDFRRLRTQEPEFADWIQQMLAAQAMEQFGRAASLIVAGSDSRLEWLFVELFRACGQQRDDGSYRLRTAVSVTQVADLILASRPWTSRTLSDWEAHGVLRRDRGWFVVPPGSPLIGRISSSLTAHTLPPPPFPPGSASALPAPPHASRRPSLAR
jgi:CRP-like cAMP-binding protein